MGLKSNCEDGVLKTEVTNGGSGPGTDVNIASVGGVAVTSPLPVDATGSAVSVTNFPASQPVTGPLTDAQLRATPVPISAASLPLPTGAATEAKQDTQITAEQAIQAAVQIMDDWDESDRAKVNLIVGQAGITAGAGAVAANTPRTTLASDDPAVAALQIIDDWDESDRAKVNPIAGQAGVQGGSGAVTALTQRTVLATDVGLPAGTSLLGRIASSDETSTIYNATTALTPKFAKITASSSGATEVVASVSSKKIRVINVVLMANAAVNVKFQSHVTPTDITGLLYLAANTGFAPGYIPTGHFETVAGEALDINLSGNVAVGGWLNYIEV